MTNKEAIEKLKEISFMTGYKEALNLAIWVLNEEEQSRGKWKGNAFDEHYCTKCGHYALWSEEADGYYEVQSNFCPNCGADMRKGGTEE